MISRESGLSRVSGCMCTALSPPLFFHSFFFSATRRASLQSASRRRSCDPDGASTTARRTRAQPPRSLTRQQHPAGRTAAVAAAEKAAAEKAAAQINPKQRRTTRLFGSKKTHKAVRGEGRACRQQFGGDEQSDGNSRPARRVSDIGKGLFLFS